MPTDQKVTGLSPIGVTKKERLLASNLSFFCFAQNLRQTAIDKNSLPQSQSDFA